MIRSNAKFKGYLTSQQTEKPENHQAQNNPSEKARKTYIYLLIIPLQINFDNAKLKASGACKNHLNACTCLDMKP